MKIQDYMTKHLTDCGLWPAETGTVIAQYLKSMSGESMQQRMNDDMTDYPKELLSIVLIGIRSEAVAWIDANKPKHFARVGLVGSPVAVEPKP